MGTSGHNQSLGPRLPLKICKSPTAPCLQAPYLCSFFSRSRDMPKMKIWLLHSSFNISLGWLYLHGQASRLTSQNPYCPSTVPAPSSNLSLNRTLLSATVPFTSLVANTSIQPALYFQFTDWKIILRPSWKTTAPSLSMPPSLSRVLRAQWPLFLNFQNDNVVPLSNVLPSTDTSPGHGHGDLAISKSPVSAGG